MAPPAEDDSAAGSQRLLLPLPNPLPVTPRDQEGLYTCWAACAEMIMEFVGGVSVRQCQQAGPPGQESWCCDANADFTLDPDCDSPNYPEFGRWGFHCEQNFGPPLSWPQVKAEIDAGRPFAFSWTRLDPSTGASLGVSHMLVVFGYEEENGQQTLVCFNPRPFGPTDVWMVRFEDYAAPPNGFYTHDADFFQIWPRP